MKHYILTIIALMLIIPAAHAMGIKENSVIQGDTITLGDVFYGLSRDEGRVLGAAPKPGEDMTLSARTLLRIAKALDLPWRPSSTADKVTLRRDATIVEYDQIKESLYTALYDEGVYGDYELDIPARHQKIILPTDAEESMVITKLSLDSSRKIFKATIAAPSADNPIQHFTMTGKITPVITIPVLRNNIQNGDIITENDLEYIKIKDRDFGQNTIANANRLIGTTPRRVLIAGRPIQKNDIVEPQIVNRGEIVILSLDSGVLNITTQVKALENGSKGDVIRVLNSASNKTIQARVTGQNEVTIIN